MTNLKLECWAEGCSFVTPEVDTASHGNCCSTTAKTFMLQWGQEVGVE